MRTRSRVAWLLATALPLGAAASMPTTAPGWLFWGCVALSCAASAAWAWRESLVPA